MGLHCLNEAVGTAKTSNAVTVTEVTTRKTVKKIHKAVLSDRRLKVRELADLVGISKSAVHRILSENLKKVMASGFWDSRGIIFIDYLKKGKTINSEYYANLLQRLSEEVKQKRPRWAKKNVLFHQGNAPAHKSIIAMTKINELKLELLPHAPCLPDLARIIFCSQTGKNGSVV